MARKKRSPQDQGHHELVQTRISAEAKAMLESKAKLTTVSVATYVRQVLYRDLGLIATKG